MPIVDQKEEAVPGYHPITRWLHAGLVLGVVFQLICAVQMAHPDHDDADHDGHGGGMTAAETAPAHHSGHADANVAMAHAEPVAAESEHTMDMSKDAAGNWWMGAHRSIGVLVALIVLANLWWAVMLRGDPRKRQIGVLFSAPCWSAAGAILKHLPAMLIGKKPMPEPGNALSLIVEMLGMLAMTAMAVTGAIVWSIWAGPGHAVAESAELWMEIHSAFATLLVAYLFGHVSMAVLHFRSGDSVFARILPWGHGR